EAAMAHTACSTGKRCMAALCCFATLIIGNAAHGAAGSPELDPLLRGSTLTPRATSALMTAVALAGTRLVAVGERGTILTSEDHGASWRQQPAPVSVMLTNVQFATARTGWAVGHSGVVLVTHDGGSTWAKQLDGVRAAEVVLAAARAQAAANADDTAKKSLAEAERLVADGADKPLLDLLVDDERTVTVVGAYGLALRSQDGGNTWLDWHGRIPNGKGNHLYAIRRSGALVYIAGEQGSVFRSADNGQSFSALTLPYNGSFFGVAMNSANTVVVFGLRGTAFASVDGGATWTQSRVDTKASLAGGTALKDGSIVVISQAGNVLRSADGRRHFHAIDVKDPVPFVGIVQ